MTTGRIIKRNGKWAYVISLPPESETGKRKQRWRSGFETRKAADEALRKDLDGLDTNVAAHATITVEQYLERWLEQSIDGKKAVRTFEAYAYTVRRYIVPNIGKFRLSQLQSTQIERMYHNLASSLSSSTVHRAHRVLRAALNRAIKRGLLSDNPMTRVDAPSAKIDRRTPLSVEQIYEVLTWLKPRYPVTHLAVYLALQTGMRRGEICGLRWCDIDIQNAVIRIVQTRQRRNGKDIVGSTKTAGSTRPVPVGRAVITTLENWRVKHEHNTVLRDITVSDTDYVLLRDDGTVIDPLTLPNDLRKALKALNLPSSSFHDLRHAHATILLRANVPLKVVSERLGHASIVLTANTYSHVTETMQREAVEQLDIALSNKSDK